MLIFFFSLALLNANPSFIFFHNLFFLDSRFFHLIFQLNCCVILDFLWSEKVVLLLGFGEFGFRFIFRLD